jgi:hypothetical protein
MKKITLLFFVLLAMLMADISFPTVSEKGNRMSIIGNEPATEPTTVSEPTTASEPTTSTTTVYGSNVIPNSMDLIWEDTFGQNIGWASATGDMVQFRGSDTRAYYKIGDPAKGYRIPTANIWNEIEEEGDGTTCSHSINRAVNTRVELGEYRGWWLDASGNWHAMTNSSTQGGTQHPPINGLVSGERGCYQQYFADERTKFDKSELIKPYINNSYRNSSNIHIFVKPQHYYRYHGWSNAKTTFPDDYAAKAIFIQQYARLVVDDPNGPDDRHLARYLIHMGSDRKEKDGTQLWNIGISRFKRVTNDWQPFNLFQGPQTKAEIEANPPPFMSIP